MSQNHVPQTPMRSGYPNPNPNPGFWPLLARCPPCTPLFCIPEKLGSPFVLTELTAANCPQGGGRYGDLKGFVGSVIRTPFDYPPTNFLLFVSNYVSCWKAFWQPGAVSNQ